MAELFDPKDPQAWSKFREGGRDAVAGINNMPYVFGGVNSGDYGSLHDMTPSDIFAKFYKGGQGGGIGQASDPNSQLGGLFGGLGGLGGLLFGSGAINANTPPINVSSGGGSFSFQPQSPMQFPTSLGYSGPTYPASALTGTSGGMANGLGIRSDWNGY